MRLLGGTPHRVAVPLAHAVPHVDEIEMRVDLHDVDRRLVAEGADAGDVDRVVAAERHRERPALQDLAHRSFRVAVARGGVGVDDVGVADIDDPHRVGGQIDGVVLVVVGPAMAEREQRGGLADGARAEAGAGAELRAHVVGHAEHRHIGLERIPVEAGRPLAEGAVADEGQIEAAAARRNACRAPGRPQA